MKLFKRMSMMFIAVFLFAGIVSFDVSATEPTETEEATPVVQSVEDNIRIGITYTTKSENYAESIKRAGAIPVKLKLVKNRTEARLALYNLDALVVAGGSAIDPIHYGSVESDKLGEITPERDASDMLMIKVAKELDMPVLGICRGMQVMNVVQGGNMYQNIKAEYDGVIEGLEHNKSGDDDYAVHDVTIDEGSKIYDIVNSSSLSVLSVHRQAVKNPGNNLVVTARSADGIVEGIEFTNQSYMIGVQFHPEKAVVANNNEQLEFFEVLKEQGSKYRQRLIENLPGPEVTSSVLTGHDDVEVFWDSVSGAIGYSVYYKKSSASSYEFFDRTKETTIDVKDLNDGVEYTFKIVPYFTREGKVYEVEHYGITKIYTMKKIENLQAKDYTSTRVRLTWDDIEGQTGYQFSESTSKTKTNIIETYKTKTGQAKQIVNDAGVTYYYKIRPYKAVRGKRIYGPWSDVVEYKRELAAPETLTTRLYGYDDVKVSWSKVEGATGYAVYYKRSTAESWSLIKRTTSRSLTKSNLSDGKLYQFKVVPYKTKNDTRYLSKNFATSEIYTLKKVAKPKVSTHLLVNIKVEWSDIKGETGYQISKSTSKSSVKVVETVPADETSVIVDRSSTKGKYYYKVRAYKEENGSKIYGPWSDYYSYSR